ncbi:MAG: LptF/LptG family permease, partial [Porphyromonadaceae bacterium]|nr:LptF/LptG family permease [Porphyromonadaceae bacterium]
MPLVKKLHLFILNTFLPLFLMTLFISIFVLLMQFLWKYVDELVGKGIDISVVCELFFYAALTIIPMALPLSMLLASLMTFGNLGERLELIAIKAAGISLWKTMTPLIITAGCIAIAAFFFQNNVLPKAQVKMYSLLFSVRQKSPELDIPEGAFYDQISGYNLLVKKKNRETGMLYDLMIYDFSEGFDNAKVMTADSGKLTFTDDKQFLFFYLYSGESFENLRNQRANANNIPYRRETFSAKEILIPFDANFNRMDESMMQNQYIGQDIAQLSHSIDSLTRRVDSVNVNIARGLKNSYFTQNSSKATAKAKRGNEEEVAVEAKGLINIDSIYANASLQERESLLGRALSRAESIRQDYEYKSVSSNNQQVLIRRHQIERYRKFTMPFACFIFFFIGAPLGAIIRKGGLE